MFWSVEVDFFSLECNEVSSSEVWDVYGFGVTLGSLYIKAQGYVPALLGNLRGVSCSGACWILGGAWFQCRYGGFWMSSYQLMFPGVRISLVSSGFGLKLPASGFQSYSYSSLKTSSSIQHWWWNISLRRQWAAFLVAWCLLPLFRSCFVEFSQCWNVLLMNLWGRKWSPRPIPLPS